MILQKKLDSLLILMKTTYIAYINNLYTNESISSFILI